MRSGSRGVGRLDSRSSLVFFMSTKPADPTPSSDLSGQIVLGRYQLLRLLGEGGMGRAYLALLIKGEGQQVVVKVMHDRFRDNPRFHELFEREMGFLRQFEHPHVVALYDSGVDPKCGPCIVMEYLDGISLSELIDRSGRLTADRAGRLVLQLCAALQSAADRGIIHRDLKPSNLMILNPGEFDEVLKVLDFGLAKMAAAPHLSLEELQGSIRRVVAVGTPEYLAPEQIRGNEIDARGDLYSVGILMYEMLTGRRPFQAEKDTDLFEMHLRAEPLAFDTLGVNDVPPGVEQVVQSCLRKYPMERPAAARVVAQRYLEALGHSLTEEEQALLSMDAASGEGDLTPLERAARSIDNPFAQALVLRGWMPEKIAILKLKGFLDDNHGEVTESEPGLVRVKLKVQTEPPPPPPPAALLWLGLAKKPKQAKPPEEVQLDLFLEKKDPAQPNNLSITALLQPPEDSALVRLNLWKKFCQRIEGSLCQHLIAEKVPLEEQG